MRQVLAWAVDQDAVLAVRLADALGWWWRLRGRLAGQYQLLSEVAALAEAGSDGWCAIQFWLGWAAYSAADLPGALGHFTAVRDAVGDRVLADALTGRSSVLLNMGRLAEGVEEGRRSLAVSRDLGYLAGEGAALGRLAFAALYSDDYDGAVQLIGQQQSMAGVPGWVMRGSSTVLIAALMHAGDLAAAESAGAAALARCQDTGDMFNLPFLLMLITDLDMEAGRFQDAAAHRREALQIALRAGELWKVCGGLWACADLCAATRRYADAATLFAAWDAYARQHGHSGGSPEEVRTREEALSKARQVLGPDRVRAAEERGAAMSLDTAASTP